MSLILVAVLVIIGLLGAAVVVIGAPVLLGVMAYDIYQSRDRGPAKPVDAEHRIQIERGIARAFVIVGGLFWSVAMFSGLNTFRQSGVAYAMLGALFPLAATLATLVVGWYYERMTSALLVLASFAVVVWGVVAAFELGVWVIVTFALIGPMMTAATLFWMARRDQEALEHSLATPGELVSLTALRGSRY